MLLGWDEGLWALSGLRDGDDVLLTKPIPGVPITWWHLSHAATYALVARSYLGQHMAIARLGAWEEYERLLSCS